MIKYDLMTREEKIEYLEKCKLDYPENHREIIYIDMQIERLKKVEK